MYILILRLPKQRRLALYFNSSIIELLIQIKGHLCNLLKYIVYLARSLSIYEHSRGHCIITTYLISNCNLLQLFSSDIQVFVKQIVSFTALKVSLRFKNSIFYRVLMIRYKILLNDTKNLKQTKCFFLSRELKNVVKASCFFVCVF